jgi:hypothetical protein
MSQAHSHTSPDAVYPFDARGVAKRFRHAAIFGALDALTPGETMRFVNDHDPLPLLNQYQAPSSSTSSSTERPPRQGQDTPEPASIAIYLIAAYAHSARATARFCCIM